MKKNTINPPFLPYRKKGKYYNYQLKKKEEKAEWLFPSIKMYWQGKALRGGAQLDTQAWIEPYKGYESCNEPVVTWLGHATMLIQMNGVNIITDPLIESPSWLYKRLLPFGVNPQELPKIDVVILSHNHRDHMDESALRFLHEKYDPWFFVPEGNKAWFSKRSIAKVQELMWWQTVEYKDTSFHFVPAWHWSQRGLFDHNKTLWGGWVVESKKDSVYFAGDTAYSELYFKTIGNIFPRIEIAIMPIGPCDPDELMRKSHMSAQQAGQAFLDCGARYFIPMHWGTFYFGTDDFYTPVERITQWWKKHQGLLDGKVLSVSKIGQQFHLEHHKNSCSGTPVQSR